MGMYISQDPIGLNGGSTNIYAYVDDTNSWLDILGLVKSYTSKRKMYDITQRGALSEFKNKQGVYIHIFKDKRGNTKRYIGRATDLSVRPHRSFKEVVEKKGAKHDLYIGTKVIVANRKLTEEELNAIEHKFMEKYGGHRSNRTYNTRASLGYGK